MFTFRKLRYENSVVHMYPLTVRIVVNIISFKMFTVFQSREYTLNGFFWIRTKLEKLWFDGALFLLRPAPSGFTTLASAAGNCGLSLKR